MSNVNKMSEDYINDKGASRRLAQSITRYWSRRGYPGIRAWVEEQEYTVKNGAPVFIYVIRSNINLKWNEGGEYYEHNQYN